MIIDAKDTVLGRVSSFAAKQLLLGNKVDIVNCEECVVSGRQHFTINEYIRKVHRGAPAKGPYFYRRPDMFVRRTIRGMLPFKKPRGQDAYKNIKCHIGFPENLKKENPIVLENSHSSKLQLSDYIRVKDICNAAGWKHI